MSIGLENIRNATIKPGDKILVEVHHSYDCDDACIEEVRQKVKKWAGVPVSVLVIVGARVSVFSTVEMETCDP